MVYPEMGYCQGINNFVALIYKLYSGNEEQIFKFMVLFFKSKELECMYCDGVPLYNIMYSSLKELMREYHSELM